jgi:hypothetical protein
MTLIQSLDRTLETLNLMMKDYIEDDLKGFLADTHSDPNDSVDFVCDRFGLSATDELIDVVFEIHEEFFGY